MKKAPVPFHLLLLIKVNALPRRYKKLQVEIGMDIPVVGSPNNFNNVTLSTKDKSVKLFLDEKGNQCYVWYPTRIAPASTETYLRDKKPYRALNYKWGILAPHFFKLVTEQRKDHLALIKLSMHPTQLLDMAS